MAQAPSQVAEEEAIRRQEKAILLRRYLEGAQVDYVETLEGSGFKYNNPNVKSTCGCGSSFSA